MVFIGVDAGTSLVKAVAFDDELIPLGSAVAQVPVRRPRPGWSEQDMTEVRDAVEDVLRRVVPHGSDVDLIAVTAQGDGCWLTDALGRPTGPALLWNDARAAAVVDAWEAEGVMQHVFDVTGSYGNAGLAHAQLTWLRAHDPSRVETARHVLSCGSWLFWGLTGRAVLDVSEACNPFLDARTDTYADDLLTGLGLSWVRPLLPPVVSGSDRVGALSASAAGRTGLRQGTPVVLAPYDVVATGIGVGAVSPGTAFAILGTTLCIGVAVVGAGLDREPAGMSLATGVRSGERVLAYATLAGTEVLDWWARILGVASAAEVTELAGTADRRDDAPTLLPYFSPAGERAPFRDPTARGSLSGLHLEHTRADVAHAVVAGLSYAVRDCLAATGAAPVSIRVCGGGARSDVWCQVLADALQVQVERADVDQVGARGAVLSAMVSLGSAGDVVDLADQVVRSGRVFPPDPTGSRHHEERFSDYVTVGHALGRR